MGRNAQWRRRAWGKCCVQPLKYVFCFFLYIWTEDISTDFENWDGTFVSTKQLTDIYRKQASDLRMMKIIITYVVCTLVKLSSMLSTAEGATYSREIC